MQCSIVHCVAYHPVFVLHLQVFRVLGIKSECQNRVAKGAKCSFRVQYVGEPGKPCQEQGIITLVTDSHLSEETTTLFFSIGIWVRLLLYAFWKKWRFHVFEQALPLDSQYIKLKLCQVEVDSLCNLFIYTRSYFKRTFKIHDQGRLGLSLDLDWLKKYMVHPLRY